MSFLKRVPYHPLLFGIFPVLALLAINIGEIKISAVLRSLVLCLLLSIILLLVLRVFLKDWTKSALVVTWWSTLFFSYGHIYTFLEQHAVLGISLGRHRLLVPLWMILVVLGFYWLVYKIRDNSNLTFSLNVVGIALFILPVGQIISYQVRMTASNRLEGPLPVINDLSVQTNQKSPDIYYIILDAYARDDVLMAQFNYDNAAFLSKLGEMGFYVARCSQSNYAQTELSLASSLNMNYLEALGDDFSSGKKDKSGLWRLIKHSEVVKILKSRGYTFVAFETGYAWSEIDEADVYLSQEEKGITAWEQIQPVNGFEALLIKTSAGFIFTDAASFVPGFMQIDIDAPRRTHRDKVLYLLYKINSIPTTIHSPKFVFAHIVAPHIPFVFGPNGEEVKYPDQMDAETFARGYRDQLTYINKRIGTIVRGILDITATPPIIIIQADHGYDRAKPAERMAILNAYYLPEGGENMLYPGISPVNTFRVVFNDYFGGKYPLLDDKSYYSFYEDPFTYTTVQNSRPDCQR